MPLKLYNTLKRDLEKFDPIDPPNVNMYVCGITPYDETHLGHGRAYIFFDVVRRYLEYSGYKVNYIQNITDIDDKIIRRAGELKVSTGELAKKYTDSYFDVMEKLNVKKASSYPKATEHIKDMIKVISGLMDKGYAYKLNGDVYFEVSKFRDYGKLSNRKLGDMEAGARVEINDKKKDPMDFALWKSAKEGEPSWDSPWGKGRPGWHIECSTMSTKYLGNTFDIHGGGLDLMFPHHENEIAQAEAYTGKPFVKYWLHNGFVTVNKEKMSKSLGNFFTLKDIFKKYNPMLIRFYLLSTHYRGPVNFSDKDIDGAKGGLERLANAFGLVRGNASCGKAPVSDKELKAIKESFIKAMDNDLNTAEAIGCLFKLCDFIFELNKQGDPQPKKWAQTTTLFEELAVDILGLNIPRQDMPGEILALAAEIKKARLAKDYKRSDELREQLTEKGYKVEITRDNDVKLGGMV